MNAQREIEKRLRQKEDEVRELEQKLNQARAYVEAMRDSLKLISKSSEGNGDTIRPGSMIDQARQFLRKTGQPVHVEKILQGMGRENTKANKVSLSGSLGHYARQGIIFTRPAPNTFGLKEFDDQAVDDLPENFGREY
jgi:hypothetical protein